MFYYLFVYRCLDFALRAALYMTSMAGAAPDITVGAGTALSMTSGAKLAIMSQRVTKIDMKTDNLTYFFATKAMAQDWIIPSRPHEGLTKMIINKNRR